MTGTVRSMTGFGAADGGAGAVAWRWEARSVNARGLDLRLRLPEGWDALEAAVRRRAGERLRRGAVSVAMRLGEHAEAGTLRCDPGALAAAVAAVRDAADALAAAGLPSAPTAPERVVALRGVLRDPAEARTGAPPDEATAAAALADLDRALDALTAARAAEGAALAAAMGAILDGLAGLIAEAEAAHAARTAEAPERLRRKVAQLLAAGAGPGEDRLAAELALLAVKADVREEIDRLTAHVAAARRLLAAGGAVGRELDFMTQELNREANTLCAKAASAALTAAGVALKVQIDQLREQAQNVE